MVIEYIEQFCDSNNFYYEKDYKGNLYVTKGIAEHYPCVVAHMDTVHKDQVELVDKRIHLNILEASDGVQTVLSANHPITGQPTGIGGDDKCGVYICLELLKFVKNIKAVFFVEEECGMLGSKNLHHKFFKDVGYALQFDAPTKNWFSYSCSGVKLWNEEFFDVIKPVLNLHEVNNISQDPFTDVVQLRKYFDFCCAVLPSGYYDQHSSSEFVVQEHTIECVEIGKKFIDALGENKYHLARSDYAGFERVYELVEENEENLETSYEEDKFFDFEKLADSFSFYSDQEIEEILNKDLTYRFISEDEFEDDFENEEY